MASPLEKCHSSSIITIGGGGVVQNEILLFYIYICNTLSSFNFFKTTKSNGCAPSAAFQKQSPQHDRSVLGWYLLS